MRLKKLLAGFNVQPRVVNLTTLSRGAADDVAWAHTASSTFLHSQLKLFDYFLCLNCGVYDTISAKEFIYFF